jgi:hypothetical protein
MQAMAILMRVITRSVRMNTRTVTTAAAIATYFHCVWSRVFGLPNEENVEFRLCKDTTYVVYNCSLMILDLGRNPCRANRYMTRALACANVLFPRKPAILKQNNVTPSNDTFTKMMINQAIKPAKYRRITNQSCEDWWGKC